MQEISKAKLFEKFVIKVLMEVGYTIRTGDEKFDFEVKDGDNWLAGEIKCYKPFVAPPVLLENGILQITKNSEGKKCVFICSSYIPDQLITEYSERYNVIIWDIRSLVFEAQKCGEDSSEIEQYLEYDISRLERATPPITTTLTSDKGVAVTTKSIAQKQHARLRAIEKIKTDIENTLPGKVDANKFETLLANLFKRLFSLSLSGWKEQQTSYDEINRVDFICRVKSQNSFWGFLSRHYNSPYITFEFKNYSEEITPVQIYTTERYLVKNALKSVCIIVARNGISDSATKAMTGFLRENNKLIFAINLSDVINMTNDYIFGNDVESTLYEILDTHLMQANR